MRILLAAVFIISTQSLLGQNLYDKSVKELNQGNVEKATRLLDELLKKEPQNTKAYFLRAYIFYSTKEFDKAIADFDNLLKIEPTNQQALKNRSLTKIGKGDFKGAIEDIDKRLELDPTNPKIYFDRGYCNGMSFNIEGSILDYDQAIRLDSTYKEAYANRGVARINMLTGKGKIQPTKEETTAACKDLKKAKELGDDSVEDMLYIYCKE